VQDQAVDLGQPVRVLGRHEPRLRQRALGLVAPADGQREAARGELRVGGHEAAAVAATRALAQLLAERGHDVGIQLAPEGAQRLQVAAAVEDERRAADERRQRADDRLQAALGEHDPLQPLLRGDRALQQRVLLVDEARERVLGQRDERQLVGHLEEREVALARGLEQRLGDLLVREAGAEAEARQSMVGQRGDVLALALRAVEGDAGGEQKLATGQPRRGVDELGDVHPAHRHVEVALAGQQGDVDVGEDLPDGQHRLMRGGTSAASPPRGRAAARPRSPRTARGRRSAAARTG
jgi:hypothetical protein